MEDEDKALILLNSIHMSYEHFKDAVIYGRDQSITLEEVQSAIRAKDLQKKSSTNGEGLNVRGRTEKKAPKGKNNKHRSKSANHKKF